jgi:hypothetical protein
MVGRHLVLGLDADLLADERLHARRRLAQIIEEGAEEAHGAQLHGDAETHVIAAPRADKGLVSVIEVEGAREIVC